LKNPKPNVSSGRTKTKMKRAKTKALVIPGQERLIEVSNEDDTSDFWNQLTGANIRLLQLVRERHPDSVYQLALFLNWDQPRVQRQCQKLHLLGLLDLEDHESNGRRCKRPVVNFERLVIKVGL